jgi:hypothetical protein
MPRTNIAPQNPVGPYPTAGVVAALALDLVWTPADIVNLNKFRLSGKEILLVWNTDVAGHTVTLTSAADEHGRSGDIAAYALAAGIVSAFSFRQGAAGWQQSDGFVYFQANDVTVKFAILSPNN